MENLPSLQKQLTKNQSDKMIEIEHHLPLRTGYTSRLLICYRRPSNATPKPSPVIIHFHGATLADILAHFARDDALNLLMLSERGMQLDAEESSGQPSIWREVYNLMRCPGPPCHLGPYCWRDSIGNKYYKLKTHHLRNLLKCVEQGYRLRTHDDMPNELREQLYAEEAQYMAQQRKQGDQPKSL